MAPRGNWESTMSLKGWNILIKQYWWINLPSDAHRVQVKTPIPVSLRLSVSCLLLPPNRALADTKKGDLALMSKGDDAKRARDKEPEKLRCIFYPICMLSVKNAKESATTARRLKSSTKTKRSPTYWTCPLKKHTPFLRTFRTLSCG